MNPTILIFSASESQLFALINTISGPNPILEGQAGVLPAGKHAGQAYVTTSAPARLIERATSAWGTPVKKKMLAAMK